MGVATSRSREQQEQQEEEEKKEEREPEVKKEEEKRIDRPTLQKMMKAELSKPFPENVVSARNAYLKRLELLRHAKKLREDELRAAFKTP